jgi:hypothetical protein
MFTRLFWKDAVERAVKSAAQAGILALGGDAANVLSLEWLTFGGAVGGAALLSLLMSLASTARGDTVSPASVASVEPYGRHARDDGPVPPPDGPTHDPHRRPVI